MADSIGSFSFIRLSGEIPVQRPVLKDISRDGVPGVAYRILPSKAREGILQGLAEYAYGTTGIAANYASYVGTLQTIVIGGVDTFANYLILDVDVPDPPKLAYSSQGVFVYLVNSTWHIRYGST